MVKRTLVKSPPELWSEVSDIDRLARHLGELGEIRISRLDPEHAVAWEGEHTHGTVEIEASGWGTRVILTAEVKDPPAEEAPTVAEEEAPAASDAEPVLVEAEPEAEGDVEVTATVPLAAGDDDRSERGGAEPAPMDSPSLEARPSRAGFLARWLFRQRRATPAPEPRDLPAPGYRPAPEPDPEPTPLTESEPDLESAGPHDAEPVPPLTADTEPVSECAAGVDPSPSADSERVRAVFESALDSLGSAHHRPFSRG